MAAAANTTLAALLVRDESDEALYSVATEVFEQQLRRIRETGGEVERRYDLCVQRHSGDLRMVD